MSTKIVAARLATSAGVTTVITRSSNPGNIVKIVKHIQASRSPPSLATKANQTPDTPDQQQTTEALLTSSITPAGSDADRTRASTPTLTPKIPLHTRFLPSPHPVRDRYFWILHGLRPHGTLYIDQGAYKALVGKAGLLPVGVVDVEGVFAQQEAVRICVVDRKKKFHNIEGVAGEEGGKLWEGEAREVGRALTNYSSTEIARIKGRQSAEVEGILGYADSEYVAQRESISFFETGKESRPMTPVREVVDGRGIGGYEGEGAVL
jgi:glutamate 5-kinase